jgi:ribonuclease PH
VEIQRLIGRALRTVVRFEEIGEKTFYLDCDVLEADGGTRTAAINGAFVALALAARACAAAGRCGAGVVCSEAAAVSVGIVGGRAMLDLDYREDAAAEADMNLAMTGGGEFVEVQVTAERGSFSSEQLGRMLALGRKGIGRLLAVGRQAIKSR